MKRHCCVRAAPLARKTHASSRGFRACERVTGAAQNQSASNMLEALLKKAQQFGIAFAIPQTETIPPPSKVGCRGQLLRPPSKIPAPATESRARQRACHR